MTCLCLYLLNLIQNLTINLIKCAIFNISNRQSNTQKKITLFEKNVFLKKINFMITIDQIIFYFF